MKETMMIDGGGSNPPATPSSGVLTLSTILAVTHKKAAKNGHLPSQFFPGCGSDTAWFEVTSSPLPSWHELSVLLSSECSDYMLMDYSEISGEGYFVAVDSDAPPPGVLVLTHPVFPDGDDDPFGIEDEAVFRV